MNNKFNMKTEKKYTWMVWAIVVLAIMNITTLLTILYHKNQTVKAEFVTATDQVQSESSSIQYSGRYFRDHLNLNSDQMNRFVEFNPAFRENVRSINYGLNHLRDEMLSEMATKNCNTTKLNTLSDSIGYLHADLKKVTYRYYLEIKNICDKQQQEKLEQLFGGMFASDGRMGQYGKGGQQGRRRGRQFNN
jgi:hypothetical protein